MTPYEQLANAWFPRDGDCDIAYQKALAMLEDVTIDAKRYRWLRYHGLSAGHGSVTVYLDDRCGTGDMHLPIRGQSLDDAIDAAMESKL